MIYKNKTNSLFVILIVFVLSACSGGNNNSDSPPPVSKGTPLPAPQNVSIKVANQALVLDWDAVDGAAKYVLYMDTFAGVTTTNDKSSSGFMTHETVDNTYTHINLQNGTTYYFAIAAVDSGGRPSGLSQEVSAQPQLIGAPQNITIRSGDSKVVIDWDSVNNADDYVLYMDKLPGVTATNDNNSSDFMQHFTNHTNTYTHINLENDTPYYFRLATVDAAGGISALSVEFSGTPFQIAAPQNLAVTGSNQTVNLQWDAVAGADHYILYMDTQAGVTTGNDKNSTDFMNHLANTNSYVHYNLVNGQEYYFAVVAVNAVDESSPLSSEVKGVPVPDVPNPPNVTGVVPGYGTIALSWDAVAGATGYNVYRSNSNGVSQTNYTDVAKVAGTTFTDTGLPNGSTYYYVVTAEIVVNAAMVQSSDSAVVTATTLIPLPAAPTNLAAQSATANEVVLSWAYNNNDVTGFRIERQASQSGLWDYSWTVAADTTTSSDSSAVPGQSYDYRVFAVNGGGDSATASNVLKVDVPLPNTPAQFAANNVTFDAVPLSWADSNYPSAGYLIERADASSNPLAWSPVLSRDTNTLTFTDTGVSAATTYYYRISAIVKGVNSLPSDPPITVVLPDSIPTAPSGLAIDSGSTLTFAQVPLHWTDKSNNETGFKIWRQLKNGDGTYTPLGNPLWQTSQDVLTWTDTSTTPGVTYRYQVAAFNSAGDSAVAISADIVVPLQTAPESLNAGTVTASSVSLSWSDPNSPQVESYLVERSDDGGTTWPATNSWPVTAPDTSYVDTTVSPASDYQYRVKAIYHTVESLPSTSLAVTTLPNPPAAPSWSTSTVTFSQATLNWTVDNSNTVDGFRIERQEVLAGGAYGPWNTPGWTVAADATYWTDNTVTPGISYRYRILAYNAGGESAWSANTTVAVLLPTAPTLSVDTSTISATGVTLNWVDNNSPASESYVLERSTDGTNWTNSWPLPGTPLNYFDNTLTATTTYYYRVSALYNSVASLPSNTVTVTTLPNTPAAPSWSAPSNVTFAQVTLNWVDNSNNEDGFRIERQEVLAGGTYGPWNTPGWVLTVADSTSWTDTIVTPGTSYRYRILAYNAGGESAWSANTTVTVPLPTAPTLSIGIGTITATSVSLNWVDNNTPASESYLLERSTDGTNWTDSWPLPATPLSYPDTTLTAATTYYYRVSALYNSMASLPSSTVTVTTLPLLPTAPTNLGVGTATSGSVPLTWTDNSDNEDGFKIQRRESATGGAWQTLTPWAPANATSWTDTTVAPGVHYDYQALATNASGDSSPSNIITVAVPPADANAFLSFLNKTAPRYQESDATGAAYYAAIDPGNLKTTFSDWKLANGFGSGGAADVPAVYLNNADLGFGRRMYVKANADGTVASYVENYPSLNDAINSTNLLAVVAMEFAPPSYKTPQEAQAAANKQVVIAENNDFLDPRGHSVYVLDPGDYTIYASRDNVQFLGDFTVKITEEVPNGDGTSTTTVTNLPGAWLYPDVNYYYTDRSNPTFPLTITTAQTKVTIDIVSAPNSDTPVTNAFVDLETAAGNYVQFEYNNSSHISIDLPAGTYTAVAATRDVGEVGDYAFNISSSSGTLSQAVTAGWVSPGSGGATPYSSANHTYTFTVTPPSGQTTDRVTIDLVNDVNNPTSLNTQLYLLGPIGDYRYVEAVNDEMYATTKQAQYAEINIDLNTGATGSATYWVVPDNYDPGNSTGYQLDVVNNVDSSSLLSSTGTWTDAANSDPWTSDEPLQSFSVTGAANTSVNVTLTLKSSDPLHIRPMLYLLDSKDSATSNVLAYNYSRFYHKSLIDIDILPGDYQIVAATDNANMVADFTLEVSVDGAPATVYADSWWNAEEENPYSPNNFHYPLTITQPGHVRVQLNSVVDTSLFIIGKGDRKFTKFFTFDSTGARIAKVDLDGRGDKHQPGVCHVCHGGEPKSLVDDGSGNMIYPDYGDTQAGFLAWDLDLYKYSSSPYTRAEQEAKFKSFNDIILRIRNVPVVESDVSAKEEVIRGWYGNPNQPGQFDGGFVPYGWTPTSQGGPANVPNGADQLYLGVVKPTCRLCHLTRRLSGNLAINFGTYEGFMAYQDEIESTIYDAATMPLALRTFDHFWQLGQADLLASYLPGFNHYQSGTTQVLQPGRPIANAGPTPRTGNRIVAVGDTVYLNGKASLFGTHYNWTVDAASPNSTTLSGANTATPYFIPSASGDYIFDLTVDDGKGLSSTASITITAEVSPVTVSLSNDLLPKLIPGNSIYSGGALGDCTSCHIRREDDIYLKFGKISGFDYAPTTVFQAYGANVYNNLLDRINLDDPAESPILEYPSSPLKHNYVRYWQDPYASDPAGPMIGYGDAQPANFTNYDLVMKWILQGAPNN